MKDKVEQNVYVPKKKRNTKKEMVKKPDNFINTQQKKKKKKNSESVADPNLHCTNKLPWTSSLDDPFSILLGSSEGGFLSLEEIDEDAYNLGQNDSAQAKKTGFSSKKRKREMEKIDDRSEAMLVQIDDSIQGLALKSTKKKKNKKKKKKKAVKDDKSEVIQLSEGGYDVDKGQKGISGMPDDDSAKYCEGGLSFDSEEISAWNELRLHPLLKKAIWALQFKEPTPIQKLCIPAAAHQGKDVIGAAETGSGKTLAFGLPILQRLLEEQEKTARKEGFTIKEGQTFTGEERGVPLRALIVTPTRELALQVCDHLRAAAKFTNIRVVPIVGGLAPQKQERLLKQRPHVIVGTPGRLWELMAGGERHLVELQSLSFFVLDEADRMIEKGHFQELQSIIDMLPQVSDHYAEPRCLDGAQPLGNTPRDNEVKHNFKRKRRQTFVFSATIALTSGFRKKLLKGGQHKIKTGTVDGNDSLAALSERAGVRENAAIVDLTSASIMAHNLEESVIECREEDKDAYLYYILKVHGCGRTIVFCTSIAALRRISAILRILKVTAWPLHAQMQQRARLKPRIPKCSVQNIQITSFTIGADATVSSQFVVGLRARNLTKKTGIYDLDNNYVTVFYTATELCMGKFPAFNQGNKNTTNLDVILTGSNIQITNEMITSLNVEQRWTGSINDIVTKQIKGVHSAGRQCTLANNCKLLFSLTTTFIAIKERLSAMDRFKENENCVLVATDVAARGLDIPGVRTVIHYQLPHSAEVYIHRSGRTARAATDGCSIALIAPNERSKYIALCHSFSKDGFQDFPVNSSYMPEVEKRLSIARKIDQILRKHSQSKAQNNWYTRNAEALELDVEDNDRDEEEPRTSKSTKAELFQAKQLQKELDRLLSCPLQPKSLSHRFVTG
ncbi:hypothetical protein KI387_035351, partial [Taxus chinensis]